MKPILCPACGGLQREPSGAELRKLREAAGATQDAVARALGVNRSYVSRVEGERQKASLRLIRYYLKTFGKATEPQAAQGATWLSTHEAVEASWYFAAWGCGSVHLGHEPSWAVARFLDGRWFNQYGDEVSAPGRLYGPIDPDVSPEAVDHFGKRKA